jgi:acetyl esterase
MNDTAPGRIAGFAATPKLLTPASAHPVLDAQTQQFLDLVAEAGLHPDDLLRHAGTAYAAQSTPDGLDLVTADIALPAGAAFPAFSMQIVRPQGDASLPTVLYFPGGGWCMADRSTHERLVRRLATEANVAVVLVEYTHAPAARFPAQNEQAYAALAYVAANASALGLADHALAVMGEGAGGNMAAALTLLAKTRRGPRIALQILFCPVLSASMNAPSWTQFADGPGMTADGLQACVSAQFPDEVLCNPLAMPLHANVSALEDLPPALIVTAENDVVRDDGEAYARKLMRAGVAVTAQRSLGTIHDFVVLDGLARTPPTDAALVLACGALRAAFRA